MTVLKPLRLGMVGGGQGAFIGAVHRMAAALDGLYTLTAGALSSTPERARASGAALGLDPERTYTSWQEMIERERALSPDRRIQVVSIVTPNATHFEIANALVAAGFHVVCDKPMVTTTAEAEALVEAVERAGVLFAVTYNYTGYPMVHQAAEMVRTGAIGRIRKVFVEYHQGWLASPIEREGQKQAAWRLNPAQAGSGGAIGDIGAHAENLLAAVTGLEIESLCADLTSFVPGRALDDDASILLRFRGSAKGVLTVSQVCIGEQNNLTLRIHGDRGSLAWRQETPDQLLHARADGSTTILVRGGPGLAPEAAQATRLPGGHPEGFIEAFANIYRAVAEAIRDGRTTGPFPSVHDGARGVRFIERAVASRGSWLPF